MATASPILGANGQPMTRERRLPDQTPRNLRASYDAARHSSEYQRHWAHADALDADTANRREIRHTLMHRARYEAGSNAYFDGALGTYVNSLVGVGPNLRVKTDNREFNRRVEQAFGKWALQVGLRRKLWCMAHARILDGEAFGIFTNNPLVDNDVQLDFVLIEAEQCQTPYLPDVMGYIDGIRFDDYGNIMWYDILPHHPGHGQWAPMVLEAERVDPRMVLHWFKMRRPGAHRGVPALTSSLNVGSNARRWREATLAAAETAADFSVLLKTAFQPAEMDSIEPMSLLDIEKRMMVALPEGYEAQQMKAEFPAERHDSFLRNLISEQSRPLQMPYNAAAMDSSTYSFASGKLDTLMFRAEIDVERKECDELVMERVFAEWYREWVILFEQRRDPSADIPHQFDWPAHPVVDAVAEAQAEDIQLKNGSTTLSAVYAAKGLDWKDVVEQMAEDYYGEATEENVDSVREMVRNQIFPSAAQAEADEQAVADAEPAQSGPPGPQPNIQAPSP